MTNPYKDLPDNRFWTRAISCVEPYKIDPVVAPKFNVTRSDLIATAGSCFAQHISNALLDVDLNYYVPESGETLDQSEKIRKGYGIFSARYGNIYTVRQLLQLFEEAFGLRTTIEKAWLRDDGRYVDPFRPTIEPDGYSSEEEVVRARGKHMEYVKKVFLDSDLFIFTAGLTESWISKSSGEVFPLAPGVSGGCYKPTSCGFVNFTVNEVINDLNLFLVMLKAINPSIRVLLTVSPVPLAATYESRHVLVSSVYSKSVLRVAVEMVVGCFDWVDYFPAYEIITGFDGRRFYENDLRKINNVGVSHVVKCFLENYVEHFRCCDARHVVFDKGARGERVGNEVFCDEELLENHRNLLE